MKELFHAVYTENPNLIGILGYGLGIYVLLSQVTCTYLVVHSYRTHIKKGRSVMIRVSWVRGIEVIPMETPSNSGKDDEKNKKENGIGGKKD